MKFFHLYLYRFTGECIPIIPLLSIFLSTAGLSLSQISLVFFTLAFTVFSLEIPTGLITDKAHPKLILIISRLLKLSAFICIYLYPVFFGFILFAFLWGASSAFDSGAFQSYVFRLSRPNNTFDKVYSKAMTASMLGILTCTLIATQIETIGYSGLHFFGLVSLSVSFLLTLFLPQVTTESTHSESSTYGLFSSLRHIHLSGVLPLLLVVGVSAGSIKGSLDEYTTLLLSTKGVALAHVGYVLLCFELLKSLGGYLSQWIKIPLVRQYSMIAFFGVCFIMAGLFHNHIVVLLALSLIILFDSALWIHNDTAIQIAATDQNRATVASIKNFCIEFASAVIFFLIWLFGNYLTTEIIYIALGVLLALIGSFLLIFNKFTVHTKQQ